MSKPIQIGGNRFWGYSPIRRGKIPNGKDRPVQGFIPGYAPDLGAMKLPCKLTAGSGPSITGTDCQERYFATVGQAMVSDEKTIQ